jgi:hypothetical protein
MYFGPGLNEPPLTPRQRAGDEVYGIDRENGRLILIIGMEMGDMVRRT